MANMAGVDGAKFNGETTTYVLAESLLFNRSKNQFSWSGSPENFESFMLRKLGFSSADILSKTSNGTCTVWKTANVTFNLYSKSKTLLVQGKAVHVQSMRNSLRQFCEETIQLDIDESSAITSNEVVHDTLGQEADDQQEEELNLMADEKSDSDAKDGGTSCFLNNFQTTAGSIEVLITNVGEKFSSEIAKIWSEIDSIKSNVLPTSHGNHQSQLLLELDELRLKCSTYESTIDNLEKEKASLLEVIKILSSSEDHENSDPTNSVSNEPTDGSEWTKVSNAKSKKPKNKKSKKNGTDANEDAVNHLNDNNSSSQAPRQSASNSAQSTDQKPCVIIAGDSMLKFINGRKLSSQISNQSLTYVKAFPGATVEDMSDYIMPSLRRKPEEVILHVGTNNLRFSEPREIADGIVNLGLKIQNHSPDCKITISSLISRSDQTLNSKIKDVNKIVNQFAKQHAWKTIPHSNIKNEHLNASGLHLNVQGTKLLAKNLISHLRNS